MLPDIKEGRLIRKRLHESPDLQAIDPGFGEDYDEAKHSETLRAELNLRISLLSNAPLLLLILRRIGESLVRKEILPLSRITNVKTTRGMLGPLGAAIQTLVLWKRPLWKRR